MTGGTAKTPPAEVAVEGVAAATILGDGRVALILGLLQAVGPFAIDMYLPGMPSMGHELQASAASVQLTLMAFFVALGFGQKPEQLNGILAHLGFDVQHHRGANAAERAERLHRGADQIADAVHIDDTGVGAG